LNTIDLICFPDLFAEEFSAELGRVAKTVPGLKSEMDYRVAPIGEIQQEIMWHCKKVGGRFAILDTSQECEWEQAWDQWSWIDGPDGAIYHPWVKVRRYGGGDSISVPPCGHVAGVYARTDRLYGVHKAPANEVLHRVLDLEHEVTNAEQDFLNPRGINCIRSFAGRGIRVWGARTLSGHPEWRYINVRRVFLTAVRWIDYSLWDTTFEPNSPALWAHIERELTAYFNAQFRRGALKGRTPQEAFYVKCNAETNPPELRDLGQVITEIGLATAVPFEFVEVRLIHGSTGVQIEGPLGLAETSQG
jgi:phage tail sheath protein FI